jgi:mono/diheme cytochrome c family protein
MTRSVVAAMLVLLAGCDRLPGKPRAESRAVRPSQVMDFAALYGATCAGCHGDEGRPGAALALADPVYLALVADETLRRVTAEGVPGTSMPGFAQSAGGQLTDRQIDVIVRELRARWGGPDRLAGAALPPYAAPPGDAARGARAYATHCASCHGATGAGGAHGGSVVDRAYLALVSDQGLRTAVLAGRPALGMPDWRGPGAAAAMSAQEIADVVAWLIGHRQEQHDG